MSRRASRRAAPGIPAPSERDQGLRTRPHKDEGPAGRAGPSLGAGVGGGQTAQEQVSVPGARGLSALTNPGLHLYRSFTEFPCGNPVWLKYTPRRSILLFEHGSTKRRSERTGGWTDEYNVRTPP